MVQDITYKQVAKLPVGQVLSDPYVRGLRYIGGAKGSYIQVRYKHPTSGKWVSKGLGRFPTLDEMREAAVDAGRSSSKPSDALEDIRDAARSITGKVRRGIDPRSGVGPDGIKLRQAIRDYGADLRHRRVVGHKEIISMLTREALKQLGDVPISALDRATLVRRIDEVRHKAHGKRWPNGRPGAARGLQVRLNVFLGWAVNQGHLKANPLAGYRRPRQTRAEALARPGRALHDSEIGPLWRACAEVGAPFGNFMQLLLLTGQRRTETAVMAWKDIDEGIWTIPAAGTKAGRAMRVPLPALALRVIAGLSPKTKGHVFVGRWGQPMTGFGARMREFRKDHPEVRRFILHDLRRTMRTGLGSLGVDRTISELMLNHAIADDLEATYDRGEYWPERVAAAKRWADRVEALVK